jgi:hypothetical protein
MAAAEEGFDAVIFMADADSNDANVWKQHKSEIEQGFLALESNLPSIACVPLSMSECWLLSSASAWRALGLGDVGDLPKRPETIWGKRNNPKADHPHNKFRRVAEKAQLPDNTETRVLIAERTELAELSAKCTISFAPFSAEVSLLRSLATNCDCGEGCCG